MFRLCCVTCSDRLCLMRWKGVSCVPIAACISELISCSLSAPVLGFPMLMHIPAPARSDIPRIRLPEVSCQSVASSCTGRTLLTPGRQLEKGVLRCRTRGHRSSMDPPVYMFGERRSCGQVSFGRNFVNSFLVRARGSWRP